MSLILEALRKSELARRAGRAPVYRDGALPTQTLVLRVLSIGAGILLMASIATSVWLLHHADGDQPLTDSPLTKVPARNADAAHGEPLLPSSDKSYSVDRAPVRRPTESAPSFAAMAGTEVREPVQSRVPASRPPASPSRQAPWISALPADVRAGVPALKITIHVYAPDEHQRILYINNRPLKRGESIDGVVVEEIVPEGAVLSIQGQRFRIPRPS